MDKNLEAYYYREYICNHCFKNHNVYNKTLKSCPECNSSNIELYLEESLVEITFSLGPLISYSSFIRPNELSDPEHVAKTFYACGKKLMDFLIDFDKNSI